MPLAKNLRGYIQTLRDKAPEELVFVDRQVNPRFEATTVLRKLELEGRRPMVVFNHPGTVKGGASPVRLSMNNFATRKKLALALDLSADQYKMDLPVALARRFAQPVAPVVLSPSDAPVREVVETGVRLDLTGYPVPVHHALDGGPYIVGGTAITRDPETGLYNAAMLRFHVKGPNTGVVHAEPAHHSGMILKKYLQKGKSCPFAIVIGHHPSFYLGSQWEGPFGCNEYEIIGGAMGEPLRLTPSVTWGDDLLVPADAEMIVEGEVLAGVTDEEGPFGEHTRYYKTIRGGKVDKRFDPAVRFTAVTRRADAIFQSCFAGHADHSLIGAIPKEAVIFERVRVSVPGVKAVHLTPGGMSRYICYVSLKQRVAGEAKDAILGAFVGDWHIKYAVAVDEDVDVFSDEEVLWAIATRTQADRDMFVIPECMGSTLDPTTPFESHRPLTARMGIDATKPVGEPFPEVCEVPLDLLKSIRLEDYLVA